MNHSHEERARVPYAQSVRSADMADRVIGTTVLFLLPITAVGYRGISVGLVVAVCLGAAVFPAALRQFEYGRAIAVLALITLLLTPLLIQFATADGSRGIDSGRETERFCCSSRACDIRGVGMAQGQVWVPPDGSRLRPRIACASRH